MTPVCLLLALGLAAPADADALLARAEHALATAELMTARRALQDALAADPDNVDALFAAGMLAREAKDPEAVTLFTRLLALDPGADEARLQLALALHEAGDTEGAKRVLDEVLARHPELSEALVVQGLIAAPPKPTRRWRFGARLGLGAGYDSNLAIAPSDERAAGLGLLDVTLHETYDTMARPFTLIAHLASTQALTDRREVSPYTSSVLGLGVIGRHYIDNLEAVLDVRYDEFFTDSFDTHRGRSISPSLYGAVPLGERHRLRLLLGADVRRVAGGQTSLDGTTQLEPSSTVARAGLRATVALGRAVAKAELIARRSFAQKDGAEVSSLTSREVDFLDLGGRGTADLAITDELSGFAHAGLVHRSFSDGEREGEFTLTSGLGLGLDLTAVELLAEYLFTLLHSPDELHRARRHGVFVGLRTQTP